MYLIITVQLASYVHVVATVRVCLRYKTLKQAVLPLTNGLYVSTGLSEAGPAILDP